MAKKSDGKWYESFVHEVHEALLAQTDVKNITIQKDVRLAGLSSTKHQIDVYWEFELAGTKYRTCVECKYHSKKITKGYVSTFADVLRDLNFPNGIFVTSEGYQSGALALGRSRGIRMLQINPPINEIHINWELHIPRIEVTRVEFDDARVKAAKAAAGMPDAKFNIDFETTTMLVDSTGKPTQRVGDLVIAVVRALKTDGPFVVPLTGHYFASPAGPLPLKQLLGSRTHTVANEPMIIKVGDEAAKAIIQDVLANTVEYVREDVDLDVIVT